MEKEKKWKKRKRKKERKKGQGREKERDKKEKKKDLHVRYKVEPKHRIIFSSKLTYYRLYVYLLWSLLPNQIPYYLTIIIIININIISKSIKSTICNKVLVISIIPK